MERHHTELQRENVLAAGAPLQGGGPRKLLACAGSRTEAHEAGQRELEGAVGGEAAGIGRHRARPCLPTTERDFSVILSLGRARELTCSEFLS